LFAAFDEFSLCDCLCHTEDSLSMEWVARLRQAFCGPGVLLSTFTWAWLRSVRITW